MEVTVLKGRGADVQQFADHIISERGVRHGHVVYLPADGAHTHGGGARHSHVHGHFTVTGMRTRRSGARQADYANPICASMARPIRP